MNEQVAFLFPGQGAQYPGMAKDFSTQFTVARETFEEADDLLGHTFSRLILEGSAEELTLTKNSQLAIFIASIAIWRVLKKEIPHLKPSVCAGLSLGEYTALVAAEKIPFSSALPLVQARGKFMQEDCEKVLSGMQVVLGLELTFVEEVIAAEGAIWVANLNCPGQIVVAGTKEALERTAPLFKEKGAKRVLPLDVAGAFHTPLMKSAQERLSLLIEEAPFVESSIDLAMNVPGKIVNALSEIRRFLCAQVTSPVYWEKGIRTLMDRGIDRYIEMGPGKTLAGMNKKIGVPAAMHSIEKISDLEAVYEFASR